MHTTRPLCFSNEIFNQYLSFVRHAQGEEGLNKLTKLLSCEKNGLENDDLWHDAERHELFLNTLKNCFPDQPDFAYQAANAAFAEKKYQIFTSMVGLLLTPEALFNRLPQAVKRMNQYNTYSFTVTSDNFALTRVVLVQEYRDPHRSQLNGYLCDACRGSIEGALRYFGYRLIEIREKKCVKKGHPHCEYQFAWVNRSRIVLLFSFLLLTLGSYAFVSAIPLDSSASKISLAILLPTLVLLGLDYFNTRKKMLGVFEYQQSLHQNQKEISEQIEKLNQKILDYQRKVAEALELASVGENSALFLQEAATIIQLLKHYSIELHSKIRDGFSEPDKIVTYSHAIEIATTKVESILDALRSWKTTAKKEDPLRK